MKKHITVIFSIMLFVLPSVTVASQNKSYREVFLEHKDHASDKWENYLDIYQFHLTPYVGKNISIMEIGVQNGGHLQILSKFLDNAKIYGIDVNEDVRKLTLGKDIVTFCFDATKKELVDSNLKDLSFDVIIDDASHISSDVIQSFELLFQRVNPNGLYIIEDLRTSYGKQFNGGYKISHSQIEYLKNLIDLLNTYHIKKDNDFNSNDIDFYNQLSSKDKELLAWINSITFYDNVAVIHKLKSPRPHKAYARNVVGTKQLIAPSIDAAKANGYYNSGR